MFHIIYKKEFHSLLFGMQMGLRVLVMIGGGGGPPATPNISRQLCDDPGPLHTADYELRRKDVQSMTYGLEWKGSVVKYRGQSGRVVQGIGTRVKGSVVQYRGQSGRVVQGLGTRVKRSVVQYRGQSGRVIQGLVSRVEGLYRDQRLEQKGNDAQYRGLE